MHRGWNEDWYLPIAFATVMGGRADQRGSRSGMDALVWEVIMDWILDWASLGVRAAIARSGNARVTSVDSEGIAAVVTEFWEACGRGG